MKQSLAVQRPAGTFERAEPTAGESRGRPSGPLFVIVGFDGTEPAERALDSATQLLRNRDGAMEVVYVAHTPTGATLSAEAMVEIRTGFDDLERRLSNEVRARLGSTEPRWHFQRRDGMVAHELTAVADELRRLHGREARIVMIVGGSAHKFHRVFGSVSMSLERDDRFPVVVVP